MLCPVRRFAGLLGRHHKLWCKPLPSLPATTLSPAALASTLNRHQLEVEVCGTPRLDLELLKRHTRLDGYTWSDPVIRSFWSVLDSLTSRQQVRDN